MSPLSFSNKQLQAAGLVGFGISCGLVGAGLNEAFLHRPPKIDTAVIDQELHIANEPLFLPMIATGNGIAPVETDRSLPIPFTDLKIPLGNTTAVVTGRFLAIFHSLTTPKFNFNEEENALHIVFTDYKLQITAWESFLSEIDHVHWMGAGGDNTEKIGFHAQDRMAAGYVDSVCKGHLNHNESSVTTTHPDLLKSVQDKVTESLIRNIHSHYPHLKVTVEFKSTDNNPINPSSVHIDCQQAEKMSHDVSVNPDGPQTSNAAVFQVARISEAPEFTGQAVFPEGWG